MRERKSDDSSWEETEERLELKRRSALRTLRDSGGVEAILSLVPEVRNTRMIGAVASCVLSTEEVHSTVTEALQAGGDNERSPMRWFIQGLLDEIDDSDADALIRIVQSSTFASEHPNWLSCLLARFPPRPGSLPRRRTIRSDGLKLYWQHFDSGHYIIPSEPQGLAHHRTMFCATTTSSTLGSSWKL